MNKIRSPIFRKWIISIFLLAGIFPSIQAALACEKIDDRFQFIVDCVQIEKEISPCMTIEACIIDKNNIDTSNNIALSFEKPSIDMDGCTAIHYVAGIVKNTTQSSSNYSIMMLDGPQPPPAILIVETIFIFNEILNDQFIITENPFPSFSTTYLMTQRFRI